MELFCLDAVDVIVEAVRSTIFTIKSIVIFHCLIICGGPEGKEIVSIEIKQYSRKYTATTSIYTLKRFFQDVMACWEILLSRHGHHACMAHQAISKEHSLIHLLYCVETSRNN